MGDANLGGLNHRIKELKTLIYPNPVVDIATLQYELTEAATVCATVLSLDGKWTKVILKESRQNAGRHLLKIDLAGFAAGTYLVKLTANYAATTVRIIKQ